MHFHYRKKMTPAENPPQMVMETLRCVESISIEISKFDMDGAVEWRTMFKAGRRRRATAVVSFIAA